MTESDDVKMTIQIGGEHLKLTVPYKRQTLVREAEKAVQRYYNDWQQKFPASHPNEILAMVTYQFAYFYQELIGRQSQAAQTAGICNSLIEEILAEARAALQS